MTFTEQDKALIYNALCEKAEGDRRAAQFVSDRDGDANLAIHLVTQAQRAEELADEFVS